MAEQGSDGGVDAATAYERGALAGALLAARGIGHCINNDLTGALGNLSIVLLAHPGLAPDVRQRLEPSTSYLQRASVHLDQFQHVRRVATRDTAGGLILDLDA